MNPVHARTTFKHKLNSSRLLGYYSGMNTDGWNNGVWYRIRINFADSSVAEKNPRHLDSNVTFTTVPNYLTVIFFMDVPVSPPELIIIYMHHGIKLVMLSAEIFRHIEGLRTKAPGSYFMTPSPTKRITVTTGQP